MITAPTFEELYQVAIARWPSTIDASSLHVTSPDRYLVPFLNAAAEQLELGHTASNVAILSGNLEDAIFSSLHAMAHFSVTLRPGDLRKDVVRADFENRLRDALKGDLCWTAGDLELAAAYFVRRV